ncbi:MAG: corrinoid protein [Clostridiales Family XIII bacterium]|jgi:5-methyltetrahydrofolate--homocysteine methyltransferase|nr:corrinoid protein [Clostridiales Family XIII bacterium]
MSVLSDIAELVQKGKAQEVADLVNQALAENISAQQILDEGLLKGMGELGVRFKNNEVFVPEVLIAARALNKGTEVLKAKLVEEDVKPIGRVVLGTVAGDLHDIGKNLVKLMLEGAGFEVIDLGTDVPADKIVAAVGEYNPDIVALSALLTTTMAAQGDAIKALVDAGVRDKVKVMVGGAPITDAFAKEIGADAYTEDASAAAEAAKALIA